MYSFISTVFCLLKHCSNSTEMGNWFKCYVALGVGELRQVDVRTFYLFTAYGGVPYAAYRWRVISWKLIAS